MGQQTHSDLRSSHPSYSKGNALVGTRIGIDATNLRLGGGITHLVELLSALDPLEHGIAKIIVWGGQKTLDRLPERTWLCKLSPPPLNGNLLSRTLWQVFGLSRTAKAQQCDLLFVPGGSYAGSFHPVVTMSQNLLPFEWAEVKRNGISFFTCKMLILRWVQAWSFQRSEGVIFLTQYAKNAVLKVTGELSANTTVIAHGLSNRFGRVLRSAQDIHGYSREHPFRLIYVSNVDAYKHQLTVFKAIELLRQKSYPLNILFIGPGVPPYTYALEKALIAADPRGQWAQYLGPLPYEHLQNYYASAQLGIFASSCETFGIILLEKMATGLPLACSDRSSMNEILRDGGLYFDPESEIDIAQTIEQYLYSAELQSQKSALSYELSQTYSWQRCAKETFSFLVQIALTAKSQQTA